MTILCTTCGARVGAGQAYCTSCGARINAVPEASRAPTRAEQTRRPAEAPTERLAVRAATSRRAQPPDTAPSSIGSRNAATHSKTFRQRIASYRTAMIAVALTMLLSGGAVAAVMLGKHAKIASHHHVAPPTTAVGTTPQAQMTNGTPIPPTPPPAATTMPQSSATSGTATPPPATTTAPAAAQPATATAMPQSSGPTGTATPPPGLTTASAATQEPTTTGPSTPTPPPATAASTASDDQAILASINGHWTAIGQGRFADAYHYLGPGLATGEARWVSHHEADRIVSVSDAFHVVQTNGTTATVAVDELRTEDAHGCRAWSGQYTLTNADGRWLINGTTVHPTRC
jgi:hypothetical protein